MSKIYILIEDNEAERSIEVTGIILKDEPHTELNMAIPSHAVCAYIQNHFSLICEEARKFRQQGAKAEPAENATPAGRESA